MVDETWKRRRRERGRARRYDPMAEPVQLPAGFVGKIRGALQVAVSDLRECLSWLDREIGTPMSEVGITLHLNREYGKPGEADADDIVADVWFDDPHGGRNRQRFTWVFSDGALPQSTNGFVTSAQGEPRAIRFLLTARGHHRIPDAKSWSDLRNELGEPEIAELEQRLGIKKQAPNQPQTNPESTPNRPRIDPESTPNQPRINPESTPQ